MAKEASTKVIHSVGGAHTHIVLELAREGSREALLYLGSALTLSYSVHRDKVPVFNCGSHIVDGFSIGNKYVAGSLITMMNDTDEFAEFMKSISDTHRDDPYSDIVSAKEVHSYMRDDLVPFNVHLIFANEYSSKLKRIIIYDATFINNGQVMSINDLITENTMSFIARDIDEQHDMGVPRGSISNSASYTKASSLV